jgi:hypothetical protein
VTRVAKAHWSLQLPYSWAETGIWDIVSLVRRNYPNRIEEGGSLMLARIFRGAAAVMCVAGGLLIDAQLVGSSSSASAASSCSSAAQLLIAHQDGSVNVESPASASCGPAPYYGSLAGTHLKAPIAGIATTPYGGGYWLAGADGGVFTFGNANYYGSLGNTHLNAPIVGIAPTPDGGGYWLVASDGGVFSFGDANFYGSMGGTRLNAPIVGIAVDAATGGYWLTASDGGVFAFHAAYFGSMAGTQLAASVRFIQGTTDGRGYRLVAGDGGVFGFGDAQFYGSGTNLGVYGWGALTPTPDNGGYWLATNFAPNGELNVASFGDATPYNERINGGATLTKSPVIAAATYLPYTGGSVPPPPNTTTPPPPNHCAASPIIVQQPVSEVVPVGGTASFTALASSTPAASVQWQVSVDQGATFANIANATATTLTFPVATNESGGFYRAVFTNSSGSSVTQPATLTVGGAPDVVTEPTNQYPSVSGGMATFASAANGTPSPTVQWLSSTDGTTWLDVPGATSDTLTVTVPATTAIAPKETEYRAFFTNSAGSAQSSIATLFVGNPPDSGIAPC